MTSLQMDRPSTARVLISLTRIFFLQAFQLKRKQKPKKAISKGHAVDFSYNVCGISKFFSLIRRYAMPVKSCKLGYKCIIWNSWSWSSEDSLVCHTYCDTGHPFHWRVWDIHTWAKGMAVELSLPVYDFHFIPYQ